MFEQSVVVSGGEEQSVHDLVSLANEVRREYFADEIPLPIRWGVRPNRKRRRSIRLGSYDHRSQEIRVHPTLDAGFVPRFFIQSIIFHEYLHHILGASHNRRFKLFEARYRFHREAQEWLKRNLPLLLGRRRSPLTLKVIPGGKVAPAAQLPLF
ncbi:MAG: hypothetical protein ABI718_06060 [Acidobacteriota bacterium]